MLHILSSFAEFERELISERTRDNMGAARKRGQWLGGRPPLGYDVDRESRKLVINREEAKLIREIFRLYIAGNSFLKVAQILNEKGSRTKKVTARKNGKTYGGIKFGVTHTQSIITNPLYIGKVCYKGQIYDGQQEAIIDEDTFKKAQAQVKVNRVDRKATKNKDCTGLLSHILHCRACGRFMLHTYTLKRKNRKYRYYVCSNAQKRGYDSCLTKSLNAQSIEDTTIACLRRIFIDKHKNRKKRIESSNNQEIEALLSPVWDTLYPEEKRRILKTLVKEVDYDSAGKKLGIILTGSDIRLEFDVDLKQVRPLNRWHKENEIGKEPKIRIKLVLAHHLEKLVEEGRINNLKQASEWLNTEQARLDHILTLLNLSPAIQTEIMSGDNKILNQIPEYKIRSLAAESDWKKQAETWQEIKKHPA